MGLSGRPKAWKPYSVNGGPDLYYVRAFLPANFGTYSTLAAGEPGPDGHSARAVLRRPHHHRRTSASRPLSTTAVKLASFRAVGFDSAVSVEWETASELDNLGFHLYRGLSENGPWERLTSSLIPGLGSSPEGKRYSFLDSGLRNGATYFYRLEDVDRSGRVTSHGPVSATPLAGAVRSRRAGGGASPRRRGGAGAARTRPRPPAGPRTAIPPTSRCASSSARARA